MRLACCRSFMSDRSWLDDILDGVWCVGPVVCRPGTIPPLVRMTFQTLPEGGRALASKETGRELEERCSEEDIHSPGPSHEGVETSEGRDLRFCHVPEEWQWRYFCTTTSLCYRIAGYTSVRLCPSNGILSLTSLKNSNSTSAKAKLVPHASSSVSTPGRRSGV